MAIFPASTTAPAGPSKQPTSKYPPGIESIIRPKDKKAKKIRRVISWCDSISSTGTLDSHSRFGYLRPDTPDPADIAHFYREVERSPSLASPRSEKAAKRFSDCDILDEDIVVSSRATAISLVQNMQQNLCHICDDMHSTMKECFPRKRDLFEVPSYKRLRVSLLRFLETLMHLEDLLAGSAYFEDDTAIKVAFHVLRSPIDFVIGECFCILKAWGRRHVGQREGVRLEDKVRRLWAHVIHGDDERLRNLRNQVILVDATVLGELKQRCPDMTKNGKSGRAWQWLKYLEPVCPQFEECDHDEHRLKLLFAVRKYRDTNTEKSECVFRMDYMRDRHSNFPCPSLKGVR